MSARRELADALLAYLGFVGDDGHPGIEITELELNVPIEVTGRLRAGHFVIEGTPPHSRWTAGFLPQVHMTRLRVGLEEAEG
jgi:hypothetical protein